MRNSSCSSTMPRKPDSEISKSDKDDTEFYEVDDTESPKPDFVFKFEYQTKEILKALEKLNEIGDYVAFQPQKDRSSFMEEAKEASGFAGKSNCDSIVTKEEGLNQLVHEEIPQDFRGGEVNEVVAEKKLDVDEANCGPKEGFEQLVREIDVHEEKNYQDFCSIASEESDVKHVVTEADVLEEMSHSDKEESVTGDERVATSSESDSDFICSSQDDELGDLEDIGLGKPHGFDEEDKDIMEQLKELEELCRADDQNPKGAKPKGEEEPMDDSVDSNTLETLWEHQELIEQMKMELKKVRATALPTIFEESESLDMDDLKPLKIDEEYQHGDRMSVLHKFYKSYRACMHKFDILNYQKLFAIGFLQSKDPLQSFSSCKSSTLAIKSFLNNFRLCRPKIDCDPIVKFIRDVHSVLEVVYVGQLCLSWEFLQWQYEKAMEVLESDPNRIHSYNEVAGELQQFQVLLQRFVEDEYFRGPRVENYVKNRCAMHKLLQVPIIREDKSKEGKKGNAMSTDILVDTLRESIRTIWRFIQADKNANIRMACRKRSLDGDCLDPKLLVEVQADLRKKERKLKELLRSENRILKRFQKHEEEEEEDEEEGADHHHLRFFSQVDIKLVSRVLNMSTITQDQLVWCQNKLSKIHFVKRKIHVDPSFLLFPC